MMEPAFNPVTKKDAGLESSLKRRVEGYHYHSVTESTAIVA